MLAVDGLALSVRAPPGLIGFAPYGRLTFFACAKKVSKETHPCIRPRLRRGSLAPSPLQGHAVKGHPWPITALATSMSLNPFHGDSTRPPEGDLGVVCSIAVEEHRQKPDAANFNFAKIMQARASVPSGGRNVAQRSNKPQADPKGERSESRCGARKGRNPNAQYTR